MCVFRQCVEVIRGGFHLLHDLVRRIVLSGCFHRAAFLVYRAAGLRGCFRWDGICSYAVFGQGGRHFLPPSQSRFRQCLFQFCEGFFFASFCFGRLRRHRFLLLLFVQQGDVVLCVLRFIFLLVAFRFVPVDVVYGRIILYSAPGFGHVFVFAAYAVAVTDGGIRQFGVQELRRL